MFVHGNAGDGKEDDKHITNADWIMRDNMKYIVVSADIINSRSAEFRKEDIESNIQLLNTEFKDDIAIGFSLLKGDEIQGVISYGKNVFKIVRHLLFSVKPYKIRIGIGIGDIHNIPSNVLSSWELNGEAFFRARDAIDKLSKLKRKNDLGICLSSGNTKVDERINLLFSFELDMAQKWNSHTFELVKMLENGMTHEEIAEKIYGIDRNDSSIKSKRALITQQLTRSSWHKIKSTEFILMDMLYEGR